MYNESDVTTVLPASDSGWMDKDFGGYPIIYSITIFHIYPVIIIGRIFHILWYVIGLVGNAISLRIWALPKMSKVNPSAPYLISLASCDMTYQILHVFYYLKYFWGISSVGCVGICQLWNMLYLVPQYASQLVVFGFTTERFIAIFWPFLGERFRRNQRAPYIITGIFATAIVFALPQVFFWGLDDGGFCEIKLDENKVHFYGYWTLATETLNFIIVPVLALIFNIFVLRQTMKSVKGIGRLNLYSARIMRVNKRCSSRQPAIKTLLLTSFFRIFSQLPISVTYTLQNVHVLRAGHLMPLQQMTYDSQWRRFLWYWAIRIIIETVGASHHAFGIFIYIYSTRTFKLELKRMFGTMPHNRYNSSHTMLPIGSRSSTTSQSRTPRIVITTV